MLVIFILRLMLALQLLNITLKVENFPPNIEKMFEQRVH